MNITQKLTDALMPLANKVIPIKSAQQELTNAQEKVNEAGTAVEAYAATTVTLQALSAFAMLGMLYIAWQKHKSERKGAGK